MNLTRNLPVTVMVKVHWSVLLLISDTMQVTLVIPNANCIPESWLQSAMGLLSALSVIFIVKSTTAKFEPMFVVLPMSEGHFGGSVSSNIELRALFASKYYKLQQRKIEYFRMCDDL